jgi:hypothetical protein
MVTGAIGVVDEEADDRSCAEELMPFVSRPVQLGQLTDSQDR